MNQKLRFLLPLLVWLSLTVVAQSQETARGIVYNDQNKNGIRDSGEEGIPNVVVSNQIRITKTDADGGWELPVRDDCIFFVVKPRNWVTPLDENNLPQFYYIHKPNGSPESQFAGVAPTGELPASIDFPLYESPEPDTFQSIFFADPQPRDQKELDWVAHDVVEDLIGVEGKAFGVTLGDILFDDLEMFDNSNALVGLIGIPWFNVIGNHDLNMDAPDDKLSDETFERYFGPSYYAFEYGPVWFVVLDNVVWGGARPEGSGNYRGGLGGEQLAFLNALISEIPENQLILFMMHVPLHDMTDKESLFRMIENRPYTMSISGHTHTQEHHFFDGVDGWNGSQPHHHVVNVTVSGSWWSGEPDEVGIPHTTMRDGAPNGYSIITFDGTNATVDFQAARKPADYQMNIFAPEVLSPDASEPTTIYVNVFAGSEKSIVEMRFDDVGNWLPLAQISERDPYFVSVRQYESQLQNRKGRQLNGPVNSTHLWKANLPTDLPEGVHKINVRTTDMYGQVFTDERTIRVEK